MRLVFLGSGAFGLPTLERLLETHTVELVVTQPDRPAGRGRGLAPTPVVTVAAAHGLPVMKPERINDAATVDSIRAVGADAFVVIAYGQKLGAALLDGVFAINLHASLLPKYRGAAPINWAMLSGDRETGVTVITLASRMDAGAILAAQALPIDPHETAGELHDRLAALGPEVVLETLEHARCGTLTPVEQDETLVTQAPRLCKDDRRVDFDQPAEVVRARVHGLNPWPGCVVRLGGSTLKLRRVEVVVAPEGTEGLGGAGEPGDLSDDGVVRCRTGAVRLLEVQPPGKRPMSFTAYSRGHAVTGGARVRSS